MDGQALQHVLCDGEFKQRSLAGRCRHHSKSQPANGGPCVSSRRSRFPCRRLWRQGPHRVGSRRAAARPGAVRLHPWKRTARTQSRGSRDLSRGDRGAPDAAVPALDWWRGFRSSELTSLMEEAQIYNLDIAVAIAQIVQADAQVGVSGAPLLPSVTGTGNGRARAFRPHRRQRQRTRRRRLDDLLAITISASPRATWSISGARTAPRFMPPRKTPPLPATTARS